MDMGGTASTEYLAPCYPVAVLESTQTISIEVAEIEVDAVIQPQPKAECIAFSRQKLHYPSDWCQYLPVIVLVRYKVKAEELIIAVVWSRTDLAYTLVIIIALRDSEVCSS